MTTGSRRAVVVNLWTGAVVVRRLGPENVRPARAAAMSEVDVAKALRAYDVAFAGLTVAQMRDRLIAFPTQADLDAIAVAWTPWNDGAMPTVRVLESASIPARSRGPAGTVPGRSRGKLPR